MDEEPVAKRRCLNHVKEGTFGISSDPASLQSQRQGGFSEIHLTSIPHEDTNTVKPRPSYDVSAHLGWDTGAENAFEPQRDHLQQPDDVPRHTTLSGLDQRPHVQEEVARNDAHSIAGAAGEPDNNGTHGANGGRRDTKADSEVCFGMFTIPNVAILEPQFLSPQAGRVCVEVVSGRLTTLAGDHHGKHSVGSIRDEFHVETLQMLQNQGRLRLQMYCRVKVGSTVRTQARINLDAQCELSIIVYGLGTDSDKVGNYLQACGFYLQDPEHCDCDVLYANPHCLSSLYEGTLMTSSMQIPASAEENIHDPRDIFESLSGVADLEESKTPTIIKTPLKSHQKQALTFLLRRERGWALDASNNDVWTKARGSSAGYCNNVTGKLQSNPPPQFRGGIVADQMGLGKTLQMIALVASDVDKVLPAGRIAWKGTELASTLIVVPFPLLETWTDQLTHHVQHKAMTWHVYHGPRRKSEVAHLAKFNIVLTTYETVVSDKRKASQAAAQQATLFNIKWQRIIIDEAHFIGRRLTLRTQAVCSLVAHCRWIVTGTPVQNRLTDLGTLLHFLRVHPFDDLGFFDEEFLRPWKKHSDPSVLDRLRALVRFITLRRSKEVLHLMPRKDHVRRLQFSPSERELYDKIRTRTRDAFPELLSSQATTKANYFDALAWINNLRRTCNHGLTMERSPLPSIRSATPPSYGLGNDNTEILGFYPETVPIEGSSGLDLLDHVSQHLQEIDSENLGISSPVLTTSDVFATPISQNLLQVDSDRGSSGSEFPRNPECASPDPFVITTACMAMPTKIERLVRDLTDSDGDQKSIVFSFWRSTLDLIPPALEAIGLGYARLDGRLSKSQRNKSLQDFRTKRNIKVLLATLSVAGFGMNLTVATQAFLLEPQWNPMAEEQALSRIHRMGQTKPVTTVRYVMQDSIEENIYELQRKKLKLAALTISGEVRPDDHSHLEDLRFLLR